MRTTRPLKRPAIIAPPLNGPRPLRKIADLPPALQGKAQAALTRFAAYARARRLEREFEAHEEGELL